MHGFGCQRPDFEEEGASVRRPFYAGSVSALENVRALSFDCYGTLIDWDGGIEAAVASLPSLSGQDPARICALRAEAEQELQRGPYLPYGEVLRQTLRTAAGEVGCEPTEAELDRFADSMSSWKPFEDSHTALRRLADRYRLAIFSNVETRVLKASVGLLDAPFEELVTAEDIESYKPKTKHFEEGLRRLQLSKDQVVHVACSIYHDARPAKALGWKCVWVNRNAEPEPADVSADWVVPDMRTAAELLLGE